MRASAVAWIATAAVLVSACGGSSKTDPNPQPSSGSATETGTTAPASATATPTATLSVTATPTATAPASPTNPLPAVLRDTGGVTGQACLAAENAAKICVELQSSDVTVRGGIAVFGLSSGAGGVAAVYGRTQAGEWKPWFRTQNAFSLLFLPGDVRICADGDGLNVREQASLAGPVVTTLADNTIARAEEFVLDTAAASDGTRGFGWYRLTTPAEGWAHSEFLAAAAEGNCTTRDGQIGSTSTPPTGSTTTPTAGAR